MEAANQSTECHTGHARHPPLTTHVSSHWQVNDFSSGEKSQLKELLNSQLLINKAKGCAGRTGGAGAEGAMQRRLKSERCGNRETSRKIN